MATMAANPVFVDTNVLVHANNSDSPDQPLAQKALLELAGAGCELWISRQVMREYACVVSRRMNLMQQFDASAMVADLHRFGQQFQIADETASVSSHLQILIVSHDVKGKQVHDANVVATMLAFGIPGLLTQNAADFRRFVPSITLLPLL